MRVGVVSPNILNDIDAHNAMYEDPRNPWPFEGLAKKSSLLFDKLYLTENLQLTYEIVGGGSGIYEDDPKSGTLQYLAEQGLILIPQDLGYASGRALLQTTSKGRPLRFIESCRRSEIQATIASRANTSMSASPTLAIGKHMMATIRAPTKALKTRAFRF
jgi:hypothetical protein